MSNEQKREHFRIQYPLRYRPTATFAGREFIVHDISERGIAFESVNSCRFKPGDRLLGSITFSDGETFNCRGMVVRKRNNFVALHLADGIPLRKIRSEQILLISYEEANT